jgi:hypothetical protein
MSTLKEKLEALGSTPAEILINLEQQGHHFGRVSVGRGCIMQQWLHANDDDWDHELYGRAPVYYRITSAGAENLVALDAVINLNDARVEKL